MGCRVLKNMLDKDVKPSKDLWKKDSVRNVDSKVSNKKRIGFTGHIRQVRGGLEFEVHRNDG